MARRHVFATDDEGHAHQVTADSDTSLDQQVAALKAEGFTITQLDDDERIDYALLTDRLIQADTDAGTDGVEDGF